MQRSSNSFLSRDFGWRISGIVFFLLFYVYMWMWVKPHLIYHGGGQITNFPSFYTGWHFFNETVWQPGGLIEYLSACLSQFFYYSWAGAFVLTVHAVLVCAFTGCFLKKIGITRFRIISFIPAVILLITYNGYTYHFPTTVVFLTALVFSCLYVKAAPKNKVMSVLLFFLLCVVLYLISAGGYLYFALLCVIYEVFFGHRWLVGVLNGIIATLTAYILGVLVFDISLISAYSELLPLSKEVIGYFNRQRMIEFIYILYLLLPLIAIFFGLWRPFIQSLSSLLRKKSSSEGQSDEVESADDTIVPGKSPKAAQAKTSCWLRWAFQLIFLFAIAAGSVFFFGDSKQKPLFEVSYYLRSRNWPKVLEVARRYQNNSHMNHAYNRALFHLGLLPSDMFCYQQRPRCLLLSAGMDIFTLEQRFDTFYDLGTINHCETELVELLKMYGEHPEILKRLSTVRMAKNDIDTARIYLGALSKTLFYSDWAEGYLKRLETDPNLSTDSDIQRLRSLMPENDKAFYDFEIEEMLTDLLQKNRMNKMAFEYLMAFYMFRLDLDNFVRNIARLNDFDYPVIPRHYEEVILTYIYFKRRVPDLKGRTLSEQSQQRFKGFLEMANLYRNDPSTAFSELAKNYGDTYQFYYAYEVSGLKNEQTP